MKNLLLCFLLSASTLFAADSDFRKGIDLSGQTNVSGFQLNQLIDNGTVATNKGLIIWQSTTPDTNTYPKFVRYLWLDTSTTPPTLKSWATGSWVTATIGPGAVGTAQLADNSVSLSKMQVNSITTSNINDNAVTDTKISAGAITSSKYASGSIYTGALSNNTITTDLILDNAITTAKIADGQVTAPKLAAGIISSTNLAANIVNATNMQINSVANTNIQTGAIQATNIVDGVVSRGKLSFALYTNNFSTTIAIPSAGAAITNAHTLGAIPQIVRVVIKNTSTDLGWAVDDEVGVDALISSTAAETGISVAVDATNVYVQRTDGANLLLHTRNTGDQSAIDTSKWQVKIYCIIFP